MSGKTIHGTPKDIDEYFGKTPTLDEVLDEIRDAGFESISFNYGSFGVIATAENQYREDASTEIEGTGKTRFEAAAAVLKKIKESDNG